MGKGSLAAVKRTQHHVRRYPWYAKLDVRSYFASIDHETLLRRLGRELKGKGVLDLIRRIIQSHHDSPGRGLPIGSLTSQCFANFYLGPLDRFLLEELGVAGYVRYMDDFVLWTATRIQAVEAAASAVSFLDSRLGLRAKQPLQINRSTCGVTICGYRVRPDALRLSQRRRRRHLDALKSCEAAYLSGRMNALGLQRASDAAHAITAHSQAVAWRRARLAARPGRAWEDLV